MRVYSLTRQEAMRWLLRRVLRGDFDTPPTAPINNP
jgi:hypothetical protein